MTKVLIIVLFSFVLSSCNVTLQKRVYSEGFYFSHSKENKLFTVHKKEKKSNAFENQDVETSIVVSDEVKNSQTEQTKNILSEKIKHVLQKNLKKEVSVCLDDTIEKTVVSPQKPDEKQHRFSKNFRMIYLISFYIIGIGGLYAMLFLFYPTTLQLLLFVIFLAILAAFYFYIQEH